MRACKRTGSLTGTHIQAYLHTQGTPTGTQTPSWKLLGDSSKTAQCSAPALCPRLVRRLQRESSRERPRRLAGSKELVVPVLRRRLVLSSVVGIATALLVTHFATFELNAINSSLGSFMIVALTGCLFESLLSTYDVRGRLRSAVFFLMFMIL